MTCLLPTQGLCVFCFPKVCLCFDFPGVVCFLLPTGTESKDGKADGCKKARTHSGVGWSTSPRERGATVESATEKTNTNNAN